MILAPAYIDDALALRFSERHALELRYVSAWGEWFFSVGLHTWKPRLHHCAPFDLGGAPSAV